MCGSERKKSKRKDIDLVEFLLWLRLLRSEEINLGRHRRNENPISGVGVGKRTGGFGPCRRRGGEKPK